MAFRFPPIQVARWAGAALLFLSFAVGQEAPAPAPPAGGGGTNPGGGAGRPSTPNVPSIPGQTGDPRNTNDPFGRNRFPEQQMQRPIFISGKVLLQEGGAPTDQVTIERVCNGQVFPEGYTDSKGRFSFQLGQNSGMMMDASYSSMGIGGQGQGGGAGMPPGFGGRGITERDLVGCELRAALPGHRSQVVQLSGRRVMDNPDVGIIYLRRLGAVEGLTVSATRALAPKDAKKAYDKGQGALKKQKWEDAQKHLESAVTLYPKFADAWLLLGQLQERQNKPEDARKAYEESLAADPKLVPPYLRMASLAVKEQKWQEVVDSTDRAIKLNPYDYPNAYFMNAVANLQMQKLDVAERVARDGIKQDEQHMEPRLEHVLGIVLAQKSDFAGASEHLKNYLQFAPKASNADMVRKQLAEVERVSAAKKE